MKSNYAQSEEGGMQSLLGKEINAQVLLLTHERWGVGGSSDLERLGADICMELPNYGIQLCTK